MSSWLGRSFGSDLTGGCYKGQAPAPPVASTCSVCTSLRTSCSSGTRCRPATTTTLWRTCRGRNVWRSEPDLWRGPMHWGGVGHSFPQASDFPATVSVLKLVWPPALSVASAIKALVCTPLGASDSSLWYLLNMVVSRLRCHMTCGHHAAAAIYHSEAGNTMSTSRGPQCHPPHRGTHTALSTHVCNHLQISVSDDRIKSNRT